MAKQQSWVEEAIASVAGTEQSLQQVRPCSAPQILACAVCWRMLSVAWRSCARRLTLSDPLPAESAEGGSAAPARPTLGPHHPSPRAPANPRRPAQAQARVSGNDTMLLRQMDAVLAALGDTTARVLAMEEREKQQNATIQQVTPRPRLHTLSDDLSEPCRCPALNQVCGSCAAADPAGGWRRRSGGGGCVADESRGREPAPTAGEA
eukprot:COSAG04_NODE_932_length_9350_cov_665.689007_11_plen_207_part_00